MSPLLKSLLEDAGVEDVVLSLRGLSYFKNARWTGPVSDTFCSEKNLFILSRRIADQSNLTLGLTQPSADSFIDFDGKFFRAHVVVAPMAMHGTEITLRRIAEPRRHELAHFQLGPAQIARLETAVRTRASILIAGATGAGKSSLVSALLDLVPAHDRVLILEDSPELPVPNSLSTKLIARSDRFGFREGAAWDLSHLVFESLRMRPDRIVIGECRGPEAKAIATALMTGHRGVVTTLHAGSCTEALDRFDRLVAGPTAATTFSSREHWNLVLYLRLNENGQREISEFRDMRGEILL